MSRDLTFVIIRYPSILKIGQVKSFFVQYCLAGDRRKKRILNQFFYQSELVVLVAIFCNQLPALDFHQSSFAGFCYMAVQPFRSFSKIQLMISVIGMHRRKILGERFSLCYQIKKKTLIFPSPL